MSCLEDRLKKSGRPSLGTSGNAAKTLWQSLMLQVTVKEVRVYLRKSVEMFASDVDYQTFVFYLIYLV